MSLFMVPNIWTNAQDLYIKNIHLQNSGMVARFLPGCATLQPPTQGSLHGEVRAEATDCSPYPG